MDLEPAVLGLGLLTLGSWIAGRAQVGSHRRYEFFRFNCEHFAIWCKSLGETTRSHYAQMGLAESLFENYPVLGTMLEIHTRFLGWVA